MYALFHKLGHFARACKSRKLLENPTNVLKESSHGKHPEKSEKKIQVVKENI